MNRIIIISVLILLTLAANARATRVMEHYDLDSLVYLSDAIVLVRVGDSEAFKTTDGDCLVHTVRVLQSFKGSLKSNDTIRVAGVDSFNRAPGIGQNADSWDPIRRGDVVYLFLAPNDGKRGYSMYHLTDAKWAVIESGARLLDGGQVYGFGQYFPRDKDPQPNRPLEGDFVAMTKRTFPGAPILPQKDFEECLGQSEQTIVKVNRLLSEKMNPKLYGEITSTLRQRFETVKNEMAEDDELGAKLVGRLDEGVASPADILTLRSEAPWKTRIYLEDILQSHVGRSFLLDHIADPDETSERRVEFARILSQAGWSYQQDLERFAKGEIKDCDTNFATRLARLAMADPTSKLVEPLLQGVADCRRVPSNDARLAADLHSAGKILVDAFPNANPTMQYEIADTLMQVDTDSYHKVLPDAGRLLTLIEPARDFEKGLGSGSLNLVCRFRNQLKVASTLKIVLRPADGKPDIEIATKTDIGSYTDTFGYLNSITAAIPKGVAGKFHMFLRDYLNDRATGDGLGFDIDVP